jgi:outer membrane protein
MSDHAVVTQRIALAQYLGMSVSSLGDVDSSLVSRASSVDAAAVLAEARRNRPDLLAAEASLKSAELGMRSANWSRLPSVSLSGSWTPKSTSSAKQFQDAAHVSSVSGSSEAKDAWGGQLAVRLNLFDGLATEARVASARAQLLRARESRDGLLRNLEGEVQQVVLGHQEALEREALTRTALAAASENLNLIQQKYNVGSATILELIDSQVQLQRAQSDLVSALADIRVAEAAVQRVRGQRD